MTTTDKSGNSTRDGAIEPSYRADKGFKYQPRPIGKFETNDEVLERTTGRTTNNTYRDPNVKAAPSGDSKLGVGDFFGIFVDEVGDKIKRGSVKAGKAIYRGAKAAPSKYREAKAKYQATQERLLAQEEARTQARLEKAQRLAALQAKKKRIRALQGPKKKLSYGRTYAPFGNDLIGKPSNKKSNGNKKKDYDYSPFRF